MVAALPGLMAAANPFQSVTSASHAEGKEDARKFKCQLLQYYFRPRLPPGLSTPNQDLAAQDLPSKMQCMISRLTLDTNIVEAAHIVPKAKDSARVSFALT